mgnify:FL=1
MPRTVRTFSDSIRQEMPAILERVIQNTAAAYRAEAKLQYVCGSSPLSNHPTCAKIAAKAVQKVLGDDALYHCQPTTAGDDFSEYLYLVPGVYLSVGVRNPDKGAIYP